MKALMLTLKK